MKSSFIFFMVLGLFSGPLFCQEKVEKPTYTVNNLDELLAASQKAKSGEIIYIADTCHIFLPAKTTVSLNEGVTLKSGRNDRNEGALIYTTVDGLKKAIVTSGDNVVLSSLRIQGPDTSMGTKPYDPPVAEGIYSGNKNFEVKNCEISAWGYAGIHLNNGATAQIHDNYFHHIKRIGLGYAIVLDAAKATIYNNFFDNNRLAISGSGAEGTGYEAYGNVVQNSYYGGFDMHGHDAKGLKDFVNDSTSAGDTINIHDNTFRIRTTKSLQITGIPKLLIVENNSFSARNQNEAVFRRFWGKSYIPHLENNSYNNENR